MSAAGASHTHDDVAEPNWFKAIDTIVWVSVAIIACLAAEWLVGYLARERLARGADKYLAKMAAKPATSES